MLFLNPISSSRTNTEIKQSLKQVDLNNIKIYFNLL